MLSVRALLGSVALLAVTQSAIAQGPNAAEVNVKIAVRSSGGHHPFPAVVWLSPAAGTPSIPFVPHGEYTLLQKNRMFRPHLQVIPLGAIVQFPNADPFFHNVFSLFDGKRFDLGLYEAGSKKAVTFPREGVSYIFCNIHPEMSAVIVTLSTPLYAIGDTGEALSIHNVPAGDYEMKFWVEGAQAQALDLMQRRLHVTRGSSIQQQVTVDVSAAAESHKDKFGQDYPVEPKSPY